jgi:hypothetical protein
VKKFQISTRVVFRAKNERGGGAAGADIACAAAGETIAAQAVSAVMPRSAARERLRKYISGLETADDHERSASPHAHMLREHARRHLS